MKDVNFKELLDKALQDPGEVSKAFRTFHQYSFGNQLLAMFQCHERALPVGPIATYPKWRELGRQVRKGEKALVLCMPVTSKRKNELGEEEVKTFFVYKPNWFTLAQTDGEPYQVPDMPEWNKSLALASLNITEVPFMLPDGNVMGYARGHEIALNPVDPDPAKTLLHEIAHILLGHTEPGQDPIADGRNLPRNLREVEAESVAYLAAAALDLPGAATSRGYIQSWGKGLEHIPEKNAARILKVTDQVLKAGQPKVEL